MFPWAYFFDNYDPCSLIDQFKALFGEDGERGAGLLEGSFVGIWEELKTIIKVQYRIFQRPDTYLRYGQSPISLPEKTDNYLELLPLASQTGALFFQRSYALAELTREIFEAFDAQLVIVKDAKDVNMYDPTILPGFLARSQCIRMLREVKATFKDAIAAYTGLEVYQYDTVNGATKIEERYRQALKKIVNCSDTFGVRSRLLLRSSVDIVHLQARYR